MQYKSTKDYYKTPKLYTRQEIQALWGKPNYTKTADDDSEVWIYRRELAWSGVYAFVAIIIPIPLPLIIPVGTRNTELYFKDNNLKSAIYRDGEMKGYAAICGISDGPKLCHIGATE